MLTWFDNPPRRKGKRKGKSRRSPPKGYKTWTSWSRAMRSRKKGGSKMAKRRGSRKKLYGAAAAAHAKARRRGGAKRRSRPRTTTKRRTWRRTSVTTARRAGRQLRYRRTNPPRGFGGIVGQLMNGVQDAAWIVGGKAASRIIAGFIPIGAGGMAVNLAIQAAAALGAGYVGRFISPNASRMMLAGGLAGVVETFVKSLNLPLVSQALGDDFYTTPPLAVGAYPGQFGAYAASPALMAGVGDDEDEGLYQ